MAAGPPEPVELPDPSDSGNSYWLARSIWAFDEGYAAFHDVDPAFAAFLQDRLQLAVDALESLGAYGTYDLADGVQVPAWLIVDGADASAEAVLGLAAYSALVPDDADARTALAQLAEGIAAMAAGDRRTWPYGAVLPWTQSRSLWHAWASQMPAALAEAAQVLGRDDLLAPAVTDSAVFTPTLLTAGGPDNGWLPTPIDRVQIAYGVDSRLQSLLAVADASGAEGLRRLAGITASWYFGSNRAGVPVYDPATGVTTDGVQPDGTTNRNAGAESTIHGLLSMLALDAHPDVSALAQAAATVTLRDGLTGVEAESGTTDGTVLTPDDAWTGESGWSGGSAVQLAPGRTASIPVPAGNGVRSVEPVLLAQPGTPAVSRWTAGRYPLGTLTTRAGDQGITAIPGVLLPLPLTRPLLPGATTVTVDGRVGTTVVDALVVRPYLQRLSLAGDDGAATELAVSAGRTPLPATVGAAGTTSTVEVFDATGTLVRSAELTGRGVVAVPAGGFLVATR
ncbi:hypothetical protein [Cellulomonas marina]|uniref:Uncharacterized protein n=1 Tax=Cellulomonas marina TaxID=988821 RepID=A0A1I1AVA3_9CELL|nr:hypothetical protein [Cellulomonas marina]GIG30695.1 hypothetical protein Cma02nite_32950 [Cellulomonas marina]SFB42015.1 hypothetical protein SAMN05421867_1244 [Cellulomonas marina]